MEMTEEMLDAIEAVKGRREANYWDNSCKRYMEKQQATKKAVKGRRDPAYWDGRCRRYMEKQENLKKDVKNSKKG